MKKMVKQLRLFAHSAAAKVMVVLAFIGTAVFGGTAIASATTTDPVTTAFGTLQTTLTNYLELGVALVIALISLAIGVRMLVKWVRRASASS